MHVLREVGPPQPKRELSLVKADHGDSTHLANDRFRRGPVMPPQPIRLKGKYDGGGVASEK